MAQHSTRMYSTTACTHLHSTTTHKNVQHQVHPDLWHRCTLPGEIHNLQYTKHSVSKSVPTVSRKTISNHTQRAHNTQSCMHTSRFTAHPRITQLIAHNAQRAHTHTARTHTQRAHNAPECQHGRQPRSTETGSSTKSDCSLAVVRAHTFREITCTRNDAAALRNGGQKSHRGLRCVRWRHADQDLA